MCSKWLNLRIGSKLITLINKSKLAFKKKLITNKGKRCE